MQLFGHGRHIPCQNHDEDKIRSMKETETTNCADRGALLIEALFIGALLIGALLSYVSANLHELGDE